MKELEILRDIEKRIRLLDAMFEEVIEVSNSIILRWNESGISFINKHGLEFFGYRREELIGKSVMEFIPEKESSGRELRRLQADILRDPGKYVTMETENVKKNGERVWVAWSNKAVIGEDGTVEIISIGNDVTDRIRGERVMRRQEKEFKDIIEHSTDVIIRWDSALRYIYINPQMSAVTGLPPSQYLGRTIHEISPDSVRHLDKSLKAALETERIQHLELEMKTSRGERVLDMTVIPEETDGTRTVLGIARDVTDIQHAKDLVEHHRKILENLVRERTQKLLYAEHELERAKRLSALGQLAATIAHELRNPLGAIQMAVFNIRRKAGSDKIARHLDTVNKKIEESNQIISDVLMYARIKPPSFQKIRIGSVVKDCMENARHKLETCNARVDFDMEPVEDMVVEMDHVQMKEVFNNIIDNACDAVSGISGRRREITIEGRAEDGSIRVSVNDNGAGMSREILGRLKSPFFTTKSQGTGLGLTISQQIVDLHGGRIDIRSKEGEGTTVSVILPVSHPA